MVNLAIAGCTAKDLDWLRDVIGVAHLELDPWGSLIGDAERRPHGRGLPDARGGDGLFVVSSIRTG